MSGYWIILALSVAIGMELWSRFVHGVVWHGILWPLHKSHHRPLSAPQKGTHFIWEHNDLFAVLHAPVAIIMIVIGADERFGLNVMLREFLFGWGIGMSLFGLAYFVVHDGFVHHRLPVQWLSKFDYFRKVRAAHERHHAFESTHPHHGPYGLFLSPFFELPDPSAGQ